jgi:hypothetical protein
VNAGQAEPAPPRPLTVTVVAHAGLASAECRGRPTFVVRRDVRLDADRATAGAAISGAGINRGEVGTITVGGVLADDSYPLSEGAEVHVYPFFGGG